MFPGPLTASGPPRRPGVAAAQRGPGLRTASLTVGAWTLLSRATGFVRLAVIGAVLGPTFFGNLFQAANQLPNVVFELVAGQLIASLLIPALVVHLDAGDREATARVAGGFLGVVLAVFGAAAVVVAAAGPAVAAALGAGVSDAAVRADLVRLGWPLVALVMPQLLLYGFIGVANAVQNARGRFALSAAAPVLENAVVVATVVVYGLRVGGGADLSAVGVGDAAFLGAGSTLGVALHAGLQWWGVRRVGVRLRPRAGWRDPEVRRVVGRAVPSLGVAVLGAAQTFALLVVVASVPGGVVAAQLGLSFVATAVALGARPLAVAALPVLSRAFGRGDHHGGRREYHRVLGVGLFLMAPSAVAMIVLAPALAAAVALGAMTGPSAVALVAAAVAGLGLATLGEGVITLTTPAAYARLDTRAPLVAAVVRAGLLAGGLVVAVRVGGGIGDGYGVVGVAALAYSVAALGGAAALYAGTIGRLPRHTRPDRARRSTGVGHAAAAAMLASLPAAAVTVAARWLPGPAGRVGPALLGGAALAGAYLALQLRWGAPLLAPLRRRLGTPTSRNGDRPRPRPGAFTPAG